ncbi:protein-ADP-ribose hydrolase [uncultured Solobacterium sp.]|uniref:protein-ADP-ribose hydrolase n=1 Tax=uncultured Solobacterium sp. TaxID=747375 RepID=UPI0028DCD9A6|nr:protein-ADP-ribose hydrolase [uncultured Solobacterium sp.]
MKNKLQEKRLSYLIDKFKEDSNDYKYIRVPNDIEDKKRILRSLMNIRLPKQMEEAVLEVQDEYLQECIEENGIVHIDSINEIKRGISIWQGDITRLAVDAIVNAANSQMLGCFIPMHTCIDNCIHSYAGIQLREECNQKMQDLRKKFGPDYEQPTAVPMVTEAYNLPAKKVIHVVGPIVENGLNSTLEKQLMDCYWNVLEICKEYRLKTVAFCCISTGVFHFPNRRAAELAVKTVEKWLECNPNTIERVIFNVFKDEDKAIYKQLLS